jgi:hypothetical protein
LEKGRSQSIGLYTTLSVPEKPWEDESTDFILGMPRTQRGHDSVMVIVDGFLKKEHFIPGKKTNDATKVVALFFQEIVRLHGLPRSISFDRDTRFLGHFWRILWKNMGSKLLYKHIIHKQMNKPKWLTRVLGIC